MEYYYAIQNNKTKQYFRCRHTVTNKDYYSKDCNGAMLFTDIGGARENLIKGERVVKLKKVYTLEIVK